MEGEVYLEPLDFLRELSRSDVRYLLVGRQALIVLGAPVLSADYDFYLSPEPGDLKDVLRIARKKRLEVTVKDPGTAPFFSLLSDTLKLDFFRCRRYSLGSAGMVDFDDLFARRQTIRVKDFSIYLPATEDLLKTKLARNLPKDQEDIKYLQVLLERGEDRR